MLSQRFSAEAGHRGHGRVDRHLAVGRNAADAEVWVYGSRATGRARPWSDLDLAIRAADGKALDLARIGKLAGEFEESDLPFRVDITDLAAASADFRRAIQKDFAILQKPHRRDTGNRTAEFAEIGFTR